MAAINLFATGLPLLSSVLQTATGMGGGVGERCPGNRLASGIPAGASVPRDNLGPAPKLALRVWLGFQPLYMYKGKADS